MHIQLKIQLNVEQQAISRPDLATLLKKVADKIEAEPQTIGVQQELHDNDTLMGSYIIIAPFETLAPEPVVEPEEEDDPDDGDEVEINPEGETTTKRKYKKRR